MPEVIKQTLSSDFATDVRSGLTANPKSLHSKYFYDAKGDEIFQQIMQLEEYYLTASEFEIFSMQKREITSHFCTLGDFNLVELGAGDGSKTKIILQDLLEQECAFTYRPVDISANVLRQLQEKMLQEMPQLAIDPISSSYKRIVENLPDELPKVIFFLGSNIGNFSRQEAGDFIRKLSEACRSGDMLLIGVDLKKDPRIILNAYNDSKGVTKAFNINLLNRINRELGGNFDLSAFDHYATYDPSIGAAKSYLVSEKAQDVFLGELNLSVKFKAGEVIYTETSMKYELQELEELATANGFEVVEHFLDCKHYFVDTLWKKK
jgi:dimethylhistidine N-methyltransferase